MNIPNNTPLVGVICDWVYHIIWLVVSTPLKKYESQLGL